MADVFISYKSERRAAAEHLAEILTDYGYSVWWDYGLISGRDFGAQIEKELRSAKAVVVLWCPLSVNSEWVREEAALAKRLDKIIPTFIEQIDLPLGFSLSQTLDLSDWDGAPQSNKLERLLRDIGGFVGRAPEPNLEGLDRTERAWRRFGSPTLREFALVEDIERTAPARTLPSALGAKKVSDSAWDPEAMNQAPLDRMTFSIGTGCLLSTLVTIFCVGLFVWLVAWWVAAVPLAMQGALLAAFGVATVFVWRNRRRTGQRYFVGGLFAIAALVTGVGAAFPFVYRVTEGRPLAATRVASVDLAPEGPFFVRLFDPSGTKFVQWTQGREARNEDAAELVVASATGFETTTLEGLSCYAEGATWISNERLFACGRILDLTEGSPNITALPEADSRRWTLDGNGRRAAGLRDLSVAIYDLGNGAVLATDLGELAIWQGARFSPTGMNVALWGQPATIRVWDLQSNSERFRLDGVDVARPSNVFISPDDAILYYLDAGVLHGVSLSDGQALHIDAPSGRSVVGEPMFFYGGARAMMVTEGSGSECEVLVLNTLTGAWIPHDFRNTSYSCSYVTLERLGQDYVRLNIGRGLRRTDTFEEVEWSRACGWDVTTRWSADGSRVACRSAPAYANWDRDILMFDAAAGTQLATLGEPSVWGTISRGAYGFWLSPDGAQIATVADYGVARIRDVATGEVVHRFSAGPSAQILAFDEEFAVARSGSSLEVWRFAE